MMIEHRDQSSAQMSPAIENERHGPPGRGWVLGAFLLFAAVMFTGWSAGWWTQSYAAMAAAPSAHHTTMGAAAKGQ